MERWWWCWPGYRKGEVCVAVLGHNGSENLLFAKHQWSSPSTRRYCMGGWDGYQKMKNYVSAMCAKQRMVFQNPDNRSLGNIVKKKMYVGFGPENIDVWNKKRSGRRVDDESLKAMRVDGIRKQSPNKAVNGRNEGLPCRCYGYTSSVYYLEWILLLCWIQIVEKDVHARFWRRTE